LRLIEEYGIPKPATLRLAFRRLREFDDLRKRTKRFGLNFSWHPLPEGRLAAAHVRSRLSPIPNARQRPKLFANRGAGNRLPSKPLPCPALDVVRDDFRRDVAGECFLDDQAK